VAGVSAGETMFPPRAPFFFAATGRVALGLPPGQARLRPPAPATKP